MKMLILPLAIGFLGATGCTTPQQLVQRDYASAIVGSWMYTLAHRGETYLTCIIVFHADGRWGVRYPGDPSKLEDIGGRRWRIEGNKLFKTGPDDDLRLGPELRRLASKPDTIVSFTADKFVTRDETTGTYIRIQKRRKILNQAMQQTPKSAGVAHFILAKW